MLSPKFFSLIFAYTINLSSLINVGESAPIYIGHACINSSTNTSLAQNTTYLSNLILLLSYLTSNATANDGRGFHQTTVTAANPDAATGLFQCLRHVTPAVCRECVGNASREALKRCQLEKGGVIWYDACWIRYQDGSAFSPNPGTVPAKYVLSSVQLQSETEESGDLLFGQLARAMNAVSERAAAASSAAAVEEVNVTSSLTLNSVAQCTPDLSVADCEACLRSAIGFFPVCCVVLKQGGFVFLPSCIARYEFHSLVNDAARYSSLTDALPSTSEEGKSWTVTIIAIVVPSGVVLAVFFGIWFLPRKIKIKILNLSLFGKTVVKEKLTCMQCITQRNSNEISSRETFQFSLHEIEIATDKFSGDNKIGEGGFGEVYKGTLSNGQKIAVKRIIGNTGQDAQQFKNEAVLVAKLQHRNLVRLLGFCVEVEEKMVIYEYVPNRSLDYFLFDPEKQNQLDWTRRYKIISGIARGILYLHEDSRLKIIHRDLKASNVLLDEDMSPKITDFGLANVFIADQTHGSTNHIVGTYGYMSPEYAMHGQFSVKSDVFSFGVLVLEILSGKKNNFSFQSHSAGDLLSFAWELWKERTPLELLDPTIRHSFSRNEVTRCIHIALLCVQENPALRPTMTTIILMLNSYSVPLPVPQLPARLHHNNVTQLVKQANKGAPL
ncbi:Cysteine rich receptor like kinase [Parasponia andersonii]|uniref:Cysteine rich receptor like kinase n=1 Tax=Parasponia andersonii TaxID=3476 RepID=A0A2P5AWZ4_PARAD|nr:Cysteine rich receptor like kinase [Parasponia andersonii]